MKSIYKIHNKKNIIAFIFNEKKLYKSSTSLTNLHIKGSFTQWKYNPDFELKKNCSSKKSLWYLEVPFNKIMIPGNSGCPEFSFFTYVNENGAEKEIFIQPITNFCFRILSNYIIVSKNFLSEKLRIHKANKISTKIPKLNSFNLKLDSQKSRISNVRLVPGTKKLYRGYHPYKKSRPQFDTEEKRIQLVNYFLEKFRIKSVITLCGDEALKPDEKIYPPMQKIQQNNNHLFIDTSYETVYYNPLSEEYKQTIRAIVFFIISHPGPYYIHCRLGSDRTGTMSSILGLLCGASWKEIAKDYEKTSFAGIGEYRNKRLLEYPLTKILGKKPSACENLEAELGEFFTTNNILQKSQIEALRNQLK